MESTGSQLSALVQLDVVVSCYHAVKLPCIDGRHKEQALAPALFRNNFIMMLVQLFKH